MQRIIPGPAGGTADHLLDCDRVGIQADQPSKLRLDPKLWQHALHSLAIPLDTTVHPLLANNIQQAHQMPFQKIPKLVAVVGCMTATPAGDVFALLLDPSGEINAAVHRAVIAEEPSFSVGATLVLQQVSVFAQRRSSSCLCITADNVLQVFPPPVPAKRAAPLPMEPPAAKALRLCPPKPSQSQGSNAAGMHGGEVNGRPRMPLTDSGVHRSVGRVSRNPEAAEAEADLGNEPRPSQRSAQGGPALSGNNGGSWWADDDADMELDQILMPERGEPPQPQQQDQQPNRSQQQQQQHTRASQGQPRCSRGHAGPFTQGASTQLAQVAMQATSSRGMDQAGGSSRDQGPASIDRHLNIADPRLECQTQPAHGQPPKPTVPPWLPLDAPPRPAGQLGSERQGSEALDQGAGRATGWQCHEQEEEEDEEDAEKLPSFDLLGPPMVHSRLEQKPQKAVGKGAPTAPAAVIKAAATSGTQRPLLRPANLPLPSESTMAREAARLCAKPPLPASLQMPRQSKLHPGPGHRLGMPTGIAAPRLDGERGVTQSQGCTEGDMGGAAGDCGFLDLFSGLSQAPAVRTGAGPGRVSSATPPVPQRICSSTAVASKPVGSGPGAAERPRQQPHASGEATAGRCGAIQRGSGSGGRQLSLKEKLLDQEEDKDLEDF